VSLSGAFAPRMIFVGFDPAPASGNPIPAACLDPLNRADLEELGEDLKIDSCIHIPRFTLAGLARPGRPGRKKIRPAKGASRQIAILSGVPKNLSDK